ncbi:TspO/MBR-related protein [Aspergillus minisclerotigenes]|uniref:TspO/MBR-related protein n=1 Tax=Aspergillus minisclerotigenes TaxID=656917 RepID=A0A5N6J777_9EURO|nr:TspO/MBR-related protein [Aspergillus minisclerotigenes]
MAWSIALPREVFTSPILSVTAPTTVGMLVGYLVNRAGGTKQTYKSLQKPAFYPPAWLFAPMWTVLYGAMGYAAHHATVAGYSALTSSTAAQSLGTNWETLYTTQLALNYLWMPLFFGIRRPAWALADMLLLGGNVAALMQTWWKTDRTAFWLMVPYAGWLGFATYLNAGVGVLNKWTIGEKPKVQ